MFPVTIDNDPASSQSPDRDIAELSLIQGQDQGALRPSQDQDRGEVEAQSKPRGLDLDLDSNTDLDPAVESFNKLHRFIMKIKS